MGVGGDGWCCRRQKREAAARAEEEELDDIQMELMKLREHQLKLKLLLI